MRKPARKAPDQWHHPDLPEALMEAGLAAIEKHGVQGLNMRQLAKATGVSSGAPYHHFESREALLQAIAAKGFTLLRRYLSEGVTADLSPLERFIALGQGYVRFAQRHRGHFRVMFLIEVKGTPNAQLRRESAATLQLLHDAIAHCKEDGLAPNLDLRSFMLLAWSAVHGVAQLWVDGAFELDPPVTREDAETLVPRALASLLAEGRVERQGRPARSNAKKVT